MAQRYAVRWRPESYRSTIESLVINRDTASGQSGQRVRTLQLIVFDDANFPASGDNANPYRPGHPDTERHLAIADEKAILLEISAFAGLNAAQSQALWDQARNAQIAAWEAEPDIGALIQSAIGAYLSPYVIR